MTTYKENKIFRILSAIGIILVVAGHLGYNLFEIGDLFPYYSFHVFIFLFVSGYFYKKEAEESFLRNLDEHPAWGGICHWRAAVVQNAVFIPLSGRASVYV